MFLKSRPWARGAALVHGESSPALEQQSVGVPRGKNKLRVPKGEGSQPEDYDSINVCGVTAHLRTKILDFGGFDSSRILI